MQRTVRPAAWPFLAVAPALLALAACAPEDAAPFGMFLFATMIAVLIATPIVFWRAWRRRCRRP